MQFPMALLRATEFIKLGKLVQHETLRDNKLLTMLDAGGSCQVLQEGLHYFLSASVALLGIAQS